MGNWKQLSPSIYHELHLGRVYGMTDTGMVRVANQDNFLIAPDLGLVMVADGMGGHEAGEVASAAALQAVYHFINVSRPDDEARYDPVPNDPEATWTDATMRAMIVLHDAVEYANARLYETNSVNGRADGGGMGTTLTGLWQVAPDGPVFIFHIGDSRLYCYRQGRLDQLTSDQTLYQQALDAVISEPLPPRNLLLQALGPSPTVTPELLTQAVRPGDIYLLCTDGLYGTAEAGEIEALLAGAGADDLDQCCAKLIEMAKQAGGRDNITAVLLRCKD